jgi:hypothetical protein
MRYIERHNGHLTLVLLKFFDLITKLKSYCISIV